MLLTFKIEATYSFMRLPYLLIKPSLETETAARYSDNRAINSNLRLKYVCYSTKKQLT